MVPARNLQLLHRHYCDAYCGMLSSSTFISDANDITEFTKSRAATTKAPLMSSTPSTSMAQEPHNPTAQDHNNKQEQGQEAQEGGQQQQQQQQQQPLLLQEEVGTSGSTSHHSNNNSSSNTNTATAATTTVSKDWLQLGLTPPEPAETTSARQGPGASALSPAFLSLPAMPLPMPMPMRMPAMSVPRGLPTWMSQPLPPQPRVMPESMAGRADMRMVVLPPSPRPNTSGGIWFLLQAAQNQGREPFLPQILKSFLRIKDGRVTVRLLIKYLVNKLGLDDESEVEITCRGQPLLPFLTLQHVRDNIWCPRDIVSIPPDLSTTNHVMTLQYGRRL